MLHPGITQESNETLIFEEKGDPQKINKECLKG
jgi:hypothetical protein